MICYLPEPISNNQQAIVRVNELKLKILAIAAKIKLVAELELYILLNPMAAPTVGTKRNKVVVFLPYFYLFHADDIPSEFRVENQMVPYQKCEALFHWSRSSLNLQKTQVPENIYGMVLFAHLVQKNRDFELAKEFVLGHELSHAVLGHDNHLNTRPLYYILFFCAVGLFLAKRMKAKCSFLGLLTVALTLIRILVAEMKKSRRLEFEADRHYTQLSSTALFGGLYLMNQALQTYKLLFKHAPFSTLWAYMKIFSTHGTPLERVKNLVKISI